MRDYTRTGFELILNEEKLRKMEPEDQILLLCTRQDFQDQHKGEVGDLIRKCSIRWNLVFSTAVKHGVLPLVYVNLFQRLGFDPDVPPRIARVFTNYVSRYALFEEKKAEVISNTLRFLNSRSIRAMLVKGAALNLLVYECPWYTNPKDADLIVYNRRDQLAEEEIYAILNQGDDLMGFQIEYDFFEHHDINMNGVLPVDFERIWRDALKMLYRGQEVHVMSHEDMLISLCINSCRKRYFRLKSLCDIAETTYKLPDLKWDEFVIKARDYDCHIIVYAALIITKLTLGCKVPEFVLEDLGVNMARRTVINHALSSFFFPRLSFVEFPFPGKKVFGRQINLFLILPYLTYRGYQVNRKIKYVIETRGSEN